jgi:type IV pilus assembly protein PilE
MRPSTQPHRRGFTLIELMIAVVVLGILAAVAYPAFTSMIKRSRRADAIAGLTAIVQAQERYRSNHATYSASVDALSVNADAAYKYYDLALAASEDGTFVAGYKVTATPKSGGFQSSDTDCAEMSVKLQGSLFSYLAKKADGTEGADVVKQCWGR